jgi:hypothetical protein
MCERCGWEPLIDRIEADLELRAEGHISLLLAALVNILRLRRHATPAQMDAIETALESRPGALPS